MGIFHRVFRIGGLLCIILALMIGPAMAQDQKVEIDCPSKVDFNLVDEVEVVSFSCSIKDYKKKFPSIHYALAIKNVSDSPKRFRVNIFLPDGKAVGGLLPLKGNPPLAKPGEVVKGEYPVKNLVDHPQTLELLIKAMAD